MGVIISNDDQITTTRALIERRAWRMSIEQRSPRSSAR
jgi:hypothetical protein